MDPNVKELLDLLLRWIHLIAGIMWVGNSMIFNWLDRNLVMPENPKPGSQGEIWLVHSGGFYEVEKKQLQPSQMPKVLHWFKWQSYTTWISGVCLLVLVYYMGGGGFMIDPSVSKITLAQAHGIGFGTLIVGFVLYDLLWRSPLKKQEIVAIVLTLALFGAAVFVLTHFLSGRAAYIHVGAMIGTIMAGNVFFHIIPSQRVLVAETQSGQPQDIAFAKRAKQRSIHNNYLTFPLLFIMLSNHFPSTYGSPLNWLILGVIVVAGAGVRHFMNIRFTFKAWIPAIAIVSTLGVVALYVLTSRKPANATRDVGTADKVSFAQANFIVHQRCVPCHSAHPTNATVTAAPNGIMYDKPEQIKMYAERMQARAVTSKTMPLANLTGMTDEERDILGRWFIEGANTE